MQVTIILEFPASYCYLARGIAQVYLLYFIFLQTWWISSRIHIYDRTSLVSCGYYRGTAWYIVCRIWSWQWRQRPFYWMLYQTHVNLILQNKHARVQKKCTNKHAQWSHVFTRLIEHIRAWEWVSALTFMVTLSLQIINNLLL